MLERRLALLAGLMALWGGAILYNLFKVQLAGHTVYADVAEKKERRVRPLVAPRGTILDRNGVRLAVSVSARSLYVNPTQIEPEYVAEVLGPLLSLDPVKLSADLAAAKQRGRGDFPVKRFMAPSEWQSLAEQKLNYVHTRMETRRFYPGRILAHVLGGVDFEQKGYAGIERGDEPLLKGTNGHSLVYLDARRNTLQEVERVEPTTGADLTLTIDSRIQFAAENALAEAAQKQSAPTGSVVVMDPKTGDILALASYPKFDPNDKPSVKDPPELRRNNAVQAVFEPGSVFKVITLAAALETTRLTPDSPIFCPAVLSLPGRVIHESHGSAATTRSVSEVLIHSSNIGAAKIGMEVGPENMHQYVKRFGFGERTQLGVPFEQKGIFREVKQWGTTSIASISMGHEVGVTTVQLARAAAVVASGGLLVRPRLVLRQGIRAVPVEAPVRALKPETAAKLTQMMERVVLEGTGKNASLLNEGYRAAGKTGTAMIFNRAAHRYTSTYHASFMGFAPVSNPAIVVVVTLNGTHGNSGMAAGAAAPVFQKIAAEALRVLEVPRDSPDTVRALPDPTPKIILEDLPPVDSGLMPIDVPPADVETAEPAPRIPDFRGKDMSRVVSEATRIGMEVQLEGSGVARTQSPPPGTPWEPGTSVRVVFTR